MYSIRTYLFLPEGHSTSLAILVVIAFASLSSVSAVDRFCTNILGGRFVANPRSCQHWIFCQNQVATAEGVCPGIYYFDVEMQMCRYPHFVECQFDAVDVTCESMDLEWHPHPNNCDQYVACISGFPRVINCAPGLHWDPIRQLCDVPANAQCQIVPELDYTCDPTRNYITVHPNDCQKFIVCVGGEMRMNQCGQGLFFDPANLRCDLEENVQCITGEQDVQYQCDATRDFYFAPHPTNCSLYIVCVFGNRRIESCAQDLIFDWIHLRCDTRDSGFCLAPGGMKEVV